MDVYVDGELWFAAGASPSFKVDGKRFSPEGSLHLLKQTNSTGTDSYGSFAITTWSWAHTGEMIPCFVTAVRSYEDALMFEQHFPSGLNQSKSGDEDQLISAFPSFALPTSDGAPSRAFLSYQGDMVGSNAKARLWTPNGTKSGIGSGNKGSGPLCVFSTALDRSVVLSSASSFMVASQLNAGSTLSYGFMGSIESIPTGHSVEFLLSYAPSGPNAAMTAWGDKLLARYGKERHAAWSRDMTLQRLGYSTDNGAFCASACGLDPPARESSLLPLPAPLTQ